MLTIIRPTYKSIPIFLLFLALVLFGPIAPWMGIYWDDWPSLWFLHFWGPSVFPGVFESDRPLLGWVFQVTTSLVGETMIAWQFFGIITRLLSSIALGWVLQLLWPKKRFQVLSIVLLFLVYPGFRQQYIPITYAHMYIVLSIFFVSLGMMMVAQRNGRWFFPMTILSMMTSAFCMFTMEYFVGMELLRPALLWLSTDNLSSNPRKRLQRVGLQWLPYLVILGVFLIYRIQNDTPRADIILIDMLTTDLLSTLLHLESTILADIIEATALAWTDVIHLGHTVIQDVHTRTVSGWARSIGFSHIPAAKWGVPLMFIGVPLVTSLATIFFLTRVRAENRGEDPTSSTPDRQWASQAMRLGVYTLLVSGWPIWATDLRISLEFPLDRFTLLLMTGASILLVGLIEWMRWNQITKKVILGVFVGIAASIQIFNAVSYRQDWIQQNAFFWQMIWRMPGIEPGTALLVPELPFAYVTDNSLAAPIHWIYAPGNTRREMSFMIFDLRARLGNELTSLEPDTPIDVPYRWASFSGDTSQALVFYYQPPGCLKVFDPQVDVRWPHAPLLHPETISLSDTKLIKTAEPPPYELATQLWGPEPEQNWCYYFEKAELARQIGDWEQVVLLGDQASVVTRKFSKETAAELAPFIEGYARTGQWEKATRLIHKANSRSPKFGWYFCPAWQKILADTPDTQNKRAANDEVRQDLQCETTER